jgi:hypothetical protein
VDLVDRHHHGTAVTGYSAQNIDNIIHQVHCYIDLQQCSAENFVIINNYGTYLLTLKLKHCTYENDQEGQEIAKDNCGDFNYFKNEPKISAPASKVVELILLY